MNRKLIIYPAIFMAVAVFFVLINNVRPVTDIGLIEQVEGADIATPYLGRTLTIGNGETLSQTFQTPRAGRLSSLGIFFPRLNEDAAGTIRLELTRKNANGTETLFENEKAVSKLSNNEGLSIWRFKPIPVSRGEKFAIRMTANSDSGVTVFTAGDDAYAPGRAALDNRKLGLDIGFKVYYRLTWAGLHRYMKVDGRNLLGPTALLFALGALGMTMGVWFRGLYAVFGPQTNSEEPAPEEQK